MTEQMIAAIIWRGITPPIPGSKKTTCPVCSRHRGKHDERCLSVYDLGHTVEWYCHHCGWEGAEVAA